MTKCPKCGEDNGGMIDTTNHRREQMDCYCNTCSHNWVEKFVGIPKERIIPHENEETPGSNPKKPESNS